MTVEQAAQDLLAIIDSEIYANDFGGLQASRDSTNDIFAAMERLEEALAQPVTQDIPQIPQTDYSNKQWIALTEEEHIQVAMDAGCMSAGWLSYGAAVERALKERNG